MDDLRLQNACPKCGGLYLKAVKTQIGYYIACDNCPEKPFSNLIKALLQDEILKARIDELQAVLSIWELPHHEQIIAFQQVKDRVAQLQTTKQKEGK